MTPEEELALIEKFLDEQGIATECDEAIYSTYGRVTLLAEKYAQQSVHLTATPEPVCTCKVTAESYKNCDAHGNRRR